MKMLSSFLTSESGAVTIDWVVLTAGLVCFGFMVLAVVRVGLDDLSSDIGEQLETEHIITVF